MPPHTAAYPREVTEVRYLRKSAIIGHGCVDLLLDQALVALMLSENLEMHDGQYLDRGTVLY